MAQPLKKIAASLTCFLDWELYEVRVISPEDFGGRGEYLGLRLPEHST